MGYTGREWENREYENSDRNRNFGTQPVEEGKEYELEITEISSQGDGIARIEGFVIFVKRGQKGQKAKVKITRVGQRFAIGEPVQNQDKENE